MVVGVGTSLNNLDLFWTDSFLSGKLTIVVGP